MSIFNYMKKQPELPLTSESQKRPLSTGSSSDSLDAKKQNTDANNLSIPTGERTVSETEGEFVTPDTPHWVPLLFKAMDTLRGNMDSVQSDIATVIAKVDAVASDLVDFKSEINNRVAELEKAVEFVSNENDSRKTEMDTFRAKLTALEAENVKLRADQATLKDNHELLKRKADSNEQHSRNECLLLHGVAETEGENCVAKFNEVVNSKLGIVADMNTIRRAHRLGAPRTDGKPRAIIARYWSMGLRNKVYASKKNLKGTKTLITENLTARRVAIMNEARVKYGNNSVWSQEGRIYANNGHGKILLSA